MQPRRRPFYRVLYVQVLFAILFGLALMALGEKGKALRGMIDEVAHGVFGVIGLIMEDPDPA